MSDLPALFINKHILKICLLGILAYVFFGLFLPFLNKVEAATLLGTNDIINDDTVGAVGVSHNVGFVIPTTGHAIIPSDYIRITLTNYSSVTAPTSGTGWSGTPTFGVSGDVAYVTGVSVPANTGIGISGITATNPSDSADFEIQVDVANDLAGTIIYDSDSIFPQALPGLTTVSVTVGTVNATLILSGFAGPNQLITILIGGAVAGTTMSNGDGEFSRTLTSIPPGVHTVELYSQDQDLIQSMTVGFIQTFLEGTTHTVSNIVIPPTIQIDNTIVPYEDPYTLFGYAHPDSQVTMFVNSPQTQQYSTTSGSGGNWARVINSSPLSIGNHSAYANQSLGGGLQSIFTNTVHFQVVNTCLTADLDCDGDIDLADFSILMYFWHQNYPANSRADINTNFSVNLTDFSIMLFHWTV